jgi:hypothetical protein
MRCYGCGVEKDLDKQEVYPYPEKDRICEGLLPPLFVIECSTERQFKAVVVCHHCFDKLDVDMWISDNCWNKLNPVIPIDKLPNIIEDKDKKWNPEYYPIL